MKQVRGQLPKSLRDTKMIGEMRVGDVAYTVPWAMMVDMDMYCFLHAKYSIKEEEGGTVKMRIERREDGYHVFASETGEKFSPTNTIPWNGATREDLIPVAEVH